MKRDDQEGSPQMIIDHDHPQFRKRWMQCTENKYNGAFYYSKEIVQNIIPRIETDRNWVTINIQGVGANHAIVFIHNNLHPENYNWLKYYGYTDLVLVCGIPETCEKVERFGRPIYLPLSIDTEYIEQFRKAEKTKEAAIVGRKSKVEKYRKDLPDGVDVLFGMKRQALLPRMADYKKIYAVGRTAIEARALGCEVLPYDPRFPDPSRWGVIDNREAAAILQRRLDEIDR